MALESSRDRYVRARSALVTVSLPRLVEVPRLVCNGAKMGSGIAVPVTCPYIHLVTALRGHNRCTNGSS
jgi:hypothetical protein